MRVHLLGYVVLSTPFYRLSARFELPHPFWVGWLLDQDAARRRVLLVDGGSARRAVSDALQDCAKSPLTAGLDDRAGDRRRSLRCVPNACGSLPCVMRPPLARRRCGPAAPATRCHGTRTAGVLAAKSRRPLGASSGRQPTTTLRRRLFRVGGRPRLVLPSKPNRRVAGVERQIEPGF